MRKKVVHISLKSGEKEVYQGFQGGQITQAVNREESTHKGGRRENMCCVQV